MYRTAFHRVGNVSSAQDTFTIKARGPLESIHHFDPSHLIGSHLISSLRRTRSIRTNTIHANDEKRARSTLSVNVNGWRVIIEWRLLTFRQNVEATGYFMYPLGAIVGQALAWKVKCSISKCEVNYFDLNDKINIVLISFSTRSNPRATIIFCDAMRIDSEQRIAKH